MRRRKPPVHAPNPLAVAERALRTQIGTSPVLGAIANVIAYYEEYDGAQPERSLVWIVADRVLWAELGTHEPLIGDVYLDEIRSIEVGKELLHYFIRLRTARGTIRLSSTDDLSAFHGQLEIAGQDWARVVRFLGPQAHALIRSLRPGGGFDWAGLGHLAIAVGHRVTRQLTDPAFRFCQAKGLDPDSLRSTLFHVASEGGAQGQDGVTQLQLLLGALVMDVENLMTGPEYEKIFGQVRRLAEGAA